VKIIMEVAGSGTVRDALPLRPNALFGECFLPVIFLTEADNLSVHYEELGRPRRKLG
jgi:hypothetical protein